MPTTTNYGLVTPTYGDDPDGPAFFQAFANQIDAAIKAEADARVAADTTVMASRSHSAAVSVGNGLNVIIPYNTQIVDDGIPWATDHFTVPVSGYYSITGLCHWTTNATGQRAIKIYINGAAVVISQAGASSGGGVSNAIAETMKLVAGDQVAFYAFQNSTATLTTAGGVQYNRASIIRVRS